VLDADRVSEVGPLLLDENQAVFPPTGVHQGKLPAFRVESFGGTVLDIDLWGTHAALFVQGPLPGPDGDDPGPVPLVAQAGAKYDAGAHLTGVHLTTPGVYRVVVGDSTALASNSPLGHPFTLTARCTSGLLCERPFLRSPPASLGDPKGAAWLAAHVLGAPLTRALRTPSDQLDYAGALLALTTKGAPFDPMDLRTEFLAETVNLADLDEDDTQEPAPMIGELMALLGACDVPRVHPIPVRGGFSVGSFPDLSLPRCQLASSVRLAAVLNSLAVDGAAPPLRSQSASRVSYRSRSYSRVHELAAALLAAGHRIELIEERSFVRASSVSVEGQDVFWPVWMNTGLVVNGSETVRMPVGRSRIVWRISGPDVNARVALGSKLGFGWFVPSLDRPPGWVGRRAAEVLTDPVGVIESFRAAEQYMTREGDRRMAGPLCPNIGTSSDAAAALRRLVWDGSDEWLPFPLLRRRRADTCPFPPSPINAIEERLRNVPHDSDGSLQAGWSTDRQTNREGPVRLYNMTPFAMDSPMLDLFPPSVRLGLCQLERNARQPLSPACRSIMYGGSLR
jgi:hypothetical protein